MQEQIRQTQANLFEKRKQLNSSDGTEVPHLQKKVKTLEYRLEKTRQRHNESLAEIKRLKEEVNAARRERVIFDNVFKKLETDLKLKEEEFKKFLFENLQVEKEKMQVEEELKKIKTESEKELKHFKKEYENAFKISDGNEFKNENILHEEEKLEKISLGKVCSFIIITKLCCKF